MPLSSMPQGPVTLDNLHVPASALGQPGDLIRTAITIADGKISEHPAETRIDMHGAMALPCFTDMHTHLDKGHIWQRAPNPNGTFDGALATVAGDREKNWKASDLRRRMEFALRCAYAHGTRAIRTHLDSIPPQDEITWPIFREIREDWRGRIDLQAVCLLGVDGVDDGPDFTRTADIVAESGGVMGTVTYPLPDVAERIELFFEMAGNRGLSADFHADETGDPSAATLRVIAEKVLETGFDAPVVVGHCCSLAVQPDDEALHTLDLVAKAGLNIVSLPLCNMYLQARDNGRTPRWRGVTLVHEMKQRGIAVSFASDNTRDPFYAYGDLDMLEVLREATRIAHLDHSDDDWIEAFTLIPSRVCGFDTQTFMPGMTADMLICKARSWNELMARPQSDRVVLRNGVAIDRTLPDYAELDDLMETI